MSAQTAHCFGLDNGDAFCGHTFAYYFDAKSIFESGKKAPRCKVEEELKSALSKVSFFMNSSMML